MARVERLRMEDLREKLAALEHATGLSAHDFYEQYRSGELGDDPTVMQWASICYLALREGMLLPRSRSA